MKLLLFPLLSGICLLPLNNEVNAVEKPMTLHNYLLKNVSPEINSQEESGYGRMSSIAFKSQDYCRAELDNFEFDAHFSVVSATVYFSGANFREVEKGFITSSSFKPIKNLMARCLPGTRVVFDDIKVKGPDNIIRTIQGIGLLLY
jgi:hypothetical protein